MASLRDMISGNALVEAPVVFNPLTAKLAEDAGFPGYRDPFKSRFAGGQADS